MLLFNSITTAGILERFERENMFRVECQQRVVEDIVKKRLIHLVETENLLMMQEDKYCTKLQEIEREATSKSEAKYYELLRVRKALDEVTIKISIYQTFVVWL